MCWGVYLQYIALALIKKQTKQNKKKQKKNRKAEVIKEKTTHSRNVASVTRLFWNKHCGNVLHSEFSDWTIKVQFTVSVPKLSFLWSA